MNIVVKKKPVCVTVAQPKIFQQYWYRFQQDLSDSEGSNVPNDDRVGEVPYMLVGKSSQAEDVDEDCDDDLGPNLPNETLASVEALNSTIPSSLTKHTAMMKLSLRIQE